MEYGNGGVQADIVVQTPRTPVAGSPLLSPCHPPQFSTVLPTTYYELAPTRRGLPRRPWRRETSGRVPPGRRHIIVHVGGVVRAATWDTVQQYTRKNEGCCLPMKHRGKGRKVVFRQRVETGFKLLACYLMMTLYRRYTCMLTFPLPLFPFHFLCFPAMDHHCTLFTPDSKCDRRGRIAHKGQNVPHLGKRQA
jgi:hypothetical protein